MSINQKLICRPKSKRLYSVAIITLLFLGTYLPCFAEYYEIPESQGRPRSAFSDCCCRKEREDKLQVIFSCVYREGCEAAEVPYPSGSVECPGNLMFKKYTKQG